MSEDKPLESGRISKPELQILLADFWTELKYNTAGPPIAKSQHIWKRVKDYPSGIILKMLSSFLRDRIREMPTPLEMADRCQKIVNWYKAQDIKGAPDHCMESGEQKELTADDKAYRSATAGSAFAKWLKSRDPNKGTVKQYIDGIDRQFKRGKYEADKTQ